MIEQVHSLCIDMAYACAAGVGLAVVACGISRVAKLIAKGERKLTAVSLGAALMVGGMAVVGTDDAGTKPGTNVVNQTECGTNTVGQTGGVTNDWTNIDGTNTVGQTDGEWTNGTGSVSGPLMMGRFGQPNLMQGQPSAITDEDIEFGWRVASVSSNVLAAATFTMPTNATVWESAQASGRGWGAWRIPLDGWHFTYGDVGWTNGFAWVEGYFRSRFNSRANEIRLLSERLTLCPAANWSRYNLNASRPWCATNGVDGLIVTFEGAAVGDDPTKIANVQMELFPRTGEVALRYDLANVGDATYTSGLVIDGTNRFVEVGAGTREVVFQRVHPDDWDMDGIPNSIDETPCEPSLNTGYNQTDAWAMAAFPSNSTEIATMGYAAWVAARAAEPNRHLVGLRVSSPDNAWPVCLTFGDVKVMCDGSEMLYFAIDDGARYAYELSGGILDAVDFDGSEMLDGHGAGWLGPWEYQSWPSMVSLHVDSVRSGWIARKADVSVEGLSDSHFFPDGSKTVTAVVTNCHEDAYIDCTWNGGDGISFSDTHSLTTEITWNGSDSVSWTTNSVTLVTTYEGDIAVTNNYCVCVGSQSEPVATFSASCSPVQFLNDGIGGDRPERVYKLSFDLLAGHGDGGTVTLVCDGPTGTRFYHDRERRNLVTTDDPIGIYTPLSGEFGCGATAYMTSTNLGRATVRAVLSGNGMSLVTNLPFQVIEPIRKLVNNEHGGILGQRQMLNPSRLVYGTNAVLCVGVNVASGDDFALTNIHWEVASPGRKVETIVREDMGLSAVVVAADAPAGVVEVVARFNGDEVQPKFVLPIVQQRVIPIRIFMVEPLGDGKVDAWDEDEIMGNLRLANYIFQQVGIRFELQGEITTIPNSSDKWDIKTDWIEQCWDLSSGWPQRKERFVMSEQPRQLYNHYQSNDCVEVFYLGSISSAWNPNMVACHSEGGVLISNNAEESTLAHELGHVLGLWDCFAAANNGKGVRMSNHDACLSRGCFASTKDWGAETGRGFYGKSDTVSSTIYRLLMTGFPNGAYGLGMDIPDGMVKAVRGDIGTAGEGDFVPVGALQIKPDNGKVFSK